MRLRRICLDYNPALSYPYECVAWRNVGGISAGDAFTAEVAAILIEAWREDGITVEVCEVRWTQACRCEDCMAMEVQGDKEADVQQTG